MIQPENPAVHWPLLSVSPPHIRADPGYYPSLSGPRQGRAGQRPPHVPPAPLACSLPKARTPSSGSLPLSRLKREALGTLWVKLVSLHALGWEGGEVLLGLRKGCGRERGNKIEGRINGVASGANSAFTNISSSDSHPGGTWPQPQCRLASSQSTSLGSQGCQEAGSFSEEGENPSFLTPNLWR